MEIQDLLKRPDLLDSMGIKLTNKRRCKKPSLDHLKMMLCIKAADLLEMDADYRSVEAHASTDPVALSYCANAISAKVNELLKELPNG